MPIKTTSIRINYDTLARPKWFMPTGRRRGGHPAGPGPAASRRGTGRKSEGPLAVVDELDAAVAVLEPEKVRLRVEPVDVG
jgi:hypothetical protein